MYFKKSLRFQNMFGTKNEHRCFALERFLIFLRKTLTQRNYKSLEYLGVNRASGCTIFRFRLALKCKYKITKAMKQSLRSNYLVL